MSNPFAGSVPEFYDRFLGTSYFGPPARALAGRLPANPDGDVLELACGTGRATRHIRARLDPGCRLVATDLSAPMLEHAKASLGEASIEWRVADMCDLPFEAASFAAAACALGFMFPPDKPRAFAEARRVLKPGATLHFSAWDGFEANPTARTIAGVLEGIDPSLRFRAPWEMNDQAALRRWLQEAGFGEVRIDAFDFHVEGIATRDLATGSVRGTPRCSLITEKGIELETVVAQVTEALAKVGGDPYRAPARVLLVEARAGA